MAYFNSRVGTDRLGRVLRLRSSEPDHDTLVGGLRHALQPGRHFQILTDGSLPDASAIFDHASARGASLPLGYDDEQREWRTFPHRADGVPQFPPEVFREIAGSHVAGSTGSNFGLRLKLSSISIIELRQGASERILSRKVARRLRSVAAPRPGPPALHLKMNGEFVVQVLLQTALAKKAAKAVEKHPQPGYLVPSEGFRNWAMIPEVRSQLSVSRMSCFLPAFVIA